MSLLDMMQNQQGVSPDPTVAARQMGLIVPPAGAAAQPAAMPAAPGGGLSPQVAQLYGLLAQYADNPQEVGLKVAGLLAKKQQDKADQNPLNTFLKMYGSINPRDFTAQSLQKFQDHFVKTGQPKFDLLQRVDDLSSKEQVFLNDAITQAQKTEYEVGRMADLANRFSEQAGRGLFTGYAGGLNEWLKTALGGEDEVSQLRREYEQLRTGTIVNNLPPGAASDKDIELALSGWPSSRADADYLASFLRGMQKLAAIKHAQASHAAAFISRNNSQAGQLDDWEKNKNWMVQQTFDRLGLKFNPKGSEAHPAYSGQPQAGGPPPVPTAPAAPPNLAVRRRVGLGGKPEGAKDDIQSLIDKWAPK